MSFVIQAETADVNLQEWNDTGNVTKSRVDKLGTIITSVNAEPDGAGLVAGECAVWLDISGTPIKFKIIAKNGSGVVKKGEVELT